MSEKISSFKDLRVYKLAFELQQEIFQTSKRFPAEERYALTDQVRRASRSIGANLAEAGSVCSFYVYAIQMNSRVYIGQTHKHRQAVAINRLKEYNSSAGEIFARRAKAPFAHFVSKLTDADGEQAETQHWLDTATACGYVPEKDQKVLLEKGVRIGQMLGTMMAKPEKLCQQRS